MMDLPNVTVEPEVQVDPELEATFLASSTPGSPVAAWLTVERALYAVLVVMAAGVRMVGLGAQPLSPLEAAQAWPAWLGASGMTVVNAPVPVSPLLYTLQRFIFWLTDGGDAWARFVPALAGTGLVLSAWWLRRWLGRGSALLLALLLALDPWLLAFSRLGDSAVLSAFLGMMVLAGMVQLCLPETDGRRWWPGLAVGAALLLVSGPQAWSWLPVLAFFWLLCVMPAVRRGEQGRENGSQLVVHPAFLAGLFGVTVLLSTTGLLVHPEGLGYISAGLTAWGAQLWGSGDVAYPLRWVFLRLLVDQPLLLTVGVAGLFYLWLGEEGGEGRGARGEGRGARGEGRGARGEVVGALLAAPAARSQRPAATRHPPPAYSPPATRFLTAWLVWGVFLVLLPGRNPASLVMLSMPLLLATARVGGALLRYCWTDLDWQEGSLVAASLGVLLVTTALWTFSLSKQVGSPEFDGRVLLFYLALPVAAAFFIWWAGWQQSGKVIGLLVFGVLLLIVAGGSWRISFGADAPYRADLFAVTADPGIRLLVADVRKLSAIRARDDTEIPLYVQVNSVPDPQLGWNLRMMRWLTWVHGPPASVEPADRGGVKPLLIVPVGRAAGGQLPAGYVGSTYPVRRSWLPTELRQPGPLLRWMLFREVVEPPTVDSVTLWAAGEEQK